MLRTLIVALLLALPTVTIAAEEQELPKNCLIQFHADWCGPCQAMKPLVARLEKEGYPVVRINTDQQKALAHKYQVETIPCFVVIRNNKVVARHSGRMAYNDLKRLVTKLPKAVTTITRVVIPGKKIHPSPE